MRPTQVGAILQEADNVTVDTYKNLYKTAWDLQKQLAKNKAVPFAKKLKDVEGFEYRHLDSLFPNKGLGTARQSIDKSVKGFETGQLLNEQLVMKIAKGEPLGRRKQGFPRRKWMIFLHLLELTH